MDLVTQKIAQLQHSGLDNIMIICTDKNGIVMLTGDGNDPSIMPTSINGKAITAIVLNSAQKAEYDALPSNRNGVQFDGVNISALSSTVAQLLADKAAILEQARLMREVALNRLTGIRSKRMWDYSQGVNVAAATSDITAIAAADAALRNIPSDASVIAATDGPSTHAAVMALWKTIDTNLSTAAPSVASVFAGLGAI